MCQAEVTVSAGNSFGQCIEPPGTLMQAPFVSFVPNGNRSVCPQRKDALHSETEDTSIATFVPDRLLLRRSRPGRWTNQITQYGIVLCGGVEPLCGLHGNGGKTPSAGSKVTAMTRGIEAATEETGYERQCIMSD